MKNMMDVIKEKINEKGIDNVAKEVMQLEDTLNEINRCIRTDAEDIIRKTLKKIMDEDIFQDAFNEFVDNQLRRLAHAVHKANAPEEIFAIAAGFQLDKIEQEILPDMVSNLANNLIDYWIQSVKINIEANLGKRFSEKEMKELGHFFIKMTRVNYPVKESHFIILDIAKKKERAIERTLSEEYQSRQKKAKKGN